MICVDVFLQVHTQDTFSGMKMLLKLDVDRDHEQVMRCISMSISVCTYVPYRMFHIVYGIVLHSARILRCSWRYNV